MRGKIKNAADDFFKLFVKREWKVILGRKWSNMWMLAGMLSATFLAISFSNASMHYLSDKMNDPFIKWVDIRNSYGEGDFYGLEAALNDEENRQRYDYVSYQSDYYFSYMFFGSDSNTLQYYQCRFFENFQTELVAAILDDDNVVDNCKIADLYSLSDESIGIVITENALSKLGYDTAPAYLDMCHYSVGADSLGFELYDGEFAHVPIPVLGVVKRLPSNVDIISTKNLFVQDNNDNTYPFNLSCNRSYSETLRYFVPDDVDADEFMTCLSQLGSEISSVECSIDEYSFYKPEIISYIPGRYISLIGEYGQPMKPLETTEINNELLAQWGSKGVCRVFDYNFSPYDIYEKSYLSVYFNSLNNIKEFESFVGEYHVKIDMSQINSKENYNAVNIMANILSWAIIIFAIVCIILFLVDLLKSYFQEIKKNIGTFKAFGVSNKRLISIYALIVTVTVVFATLISLTAALTVQGLLDLAGILKEGEYSYLDLGSIKTLLSIVIIIISSVCTVYAVMTKLLKHTPGDLIYDR